MEGLKQGLRAFSKEPISTTSNRASFGESTIYADQSRVLVPRASGKVVSLWTCTKLCALGFAVGVVVGFTLKRRLRRWAAKILRRLKDD